MFRTKFGILALLLGLTSHRSEADSPLYDLFADHVFDIDKYLATAHFKTGDCQFVHITETNLGWPIPQSRDMQISGSSRLGSCLFDNAMASFGSSKPIGYVRTTMSFPQDQLEAMPGKPIDKPIKVFIQWKPVQALVAPSHWSQLVPASPQSLDWVGKNFNQLSRALDHYHDNSVVIRPLEPLNAKRIFGPLATEVRPVYITKIVVKTEPILDSKGHLVKGDTWKARGKVIVYTDSSGDAPYAELDLKTDLAANTNIFEKNWRLFPKQVHLTADTPGYDKELDWPEDKH